MYGIVGEQEALVGSRSVFWSYGKTETRHCRIFSIFRLSSESTICQWGNGSPVTSRWRRDGAGMMPSKLQRIRDSRFEIGALPVFCFVPIGWKNAHFDFCCFELIIALFHAYLLFPRTGLWFTLNPAHFEGRGVVAVKSGRMINPA